MENHEHHKKEEMDHSKMDHSKMNHEKKDHSKMDDSKIDHSKMKHGSEDHSGHNPGHGQMGQDHHKMMIAELRKTILGNACSYHSYLVLLTHDSRLFRL